MLKIKNQITWSHHRSGWTQAIEQLYKLHNNYGVLFEGYLDGYFGSGQVFTEKWIGFFHHTPTHHPLTQKIYNFAFDRDLERLLSSSYFKKSESLCQGVFTFSNHTCEFIRSKSNIKAEKLWFPTEEGKLFDIEQFNGEIVHIGHWQRQFDYFCKIKTQYLKYILCWNNRDKISWFLQNYDTQINDVKVMNRLDNDGYDELLSKSVVFLQLFDSSANNVIVECIVRNTPIIINRLPAVVEYLGQDYPLYYNSFEEAEYLSNNIDKIREAWEYLKRKDKSKFKIDTFVKDFCSSNIYNSLKLTRLF